jgi:hypothetical protein
MGENIKIIETMNKNNLPDLDIITLGALELFEDQGLPNITLPEFKKPIIAGSGNAKVTANILFSEKNPIFIDENNYQNITKQTNTDGAIIFSASGEKHAPIIAKHILSLNIPTYLITCNLNSSTEKLLEKNHTIITPKNKEPYTYNTSTYMGWILAITKEDPKKIREFIEKKVKPTIKENLSNYKGFLLITPNKFEKVNGLFETKFIELFGRRISRDVKTYEELKHAITVVPYNKELCIKFSKGDEVIFNGDILEIPIPKNSNYATMMAIGYFVIGNIQKQHYPYFKKNINNYCQKVSQKSFGKNIEVIVK